ncbi:MULTISPECIES: hypothetical protein [Nocardioides]|uniref:Uncharacterized protein n=1 Tax=Nocardioides vastitatis TaxID=2568655 RepID=A0ABW0ZLX6_9ACTN|nr:hypothetical protein [Nocardioides sp.]THJ01775.1 hypothetical protein E7Z54_10870 [Nocardioides sp.]
MRPLRAGLVLALVLTGAAGGYFLAEHDDEKRSSFSDPEPVAAVSPSYPVNPVVVLPDPDKPALRAGLRLHRVRVGTAPFHLGLPVPRGWERSVPAAGEWRWYPPPGLVLNTYFLRVRLIGNQYQPVEQAITSRLDALRTADDVEDFRVLSLTADGFVAEYVSAGYRRVTMEKYVVRNGADAAYAWIALVGRRQDRPGMTDLFDRVVAGARP